MAGIDLAAERPEHKTGKFEALNSERNANNGDADQNPGQKPQDAHDQAAKQ